MVLTASVPSWSWSGSTRKKGGQGEYQPQPVPPCSSGQLPPIGLRRQRGLGSASGGLTGELVLAGSPVSRKETLLPPP